MTILENGRPNRPKQGPDLRKQVDDPKQFLALSDAEKEKIREKARLTVLNELKDREEKALYDQFLREERQQTVPEEQLVPIFLNLALHSPYIMLDGVQYLNETLYHVPISVFRTLTEQMSRGWAHEDQTQVSDRTRGRMPAPLHAGGMNYMDNRRARDLTVSAGVLQGSAPNTLLGLGA